MGLVLFQGLPRHVGTLQHVVVHTLLQRPHACSGKYVTLCAYMCNRCRCVQVDRSELAKLTVSQYE